MVALRNSLEHARHQLMDYHEMARSAESNSARFIAGISLVLSASLPNRLSFRLILSAIAVAYCVWARGALKETTEQATRATVLGEVASAAQGFQALQQQGVRFLPVRDQLR